MFLRPIRWILPGCIAARSGGRGIGLKGRPGVVARSLDRATPATEGLLRATRRRMVVLRLADLRSQAVAGARDAATTEFERLPAGREMALARLLAKPPRRKGVAWLGRTPGPCGGRSDQRRNVGRDKMADDIVALLAQPRGALVPQPLLRESGRGRSVPPQPQRTQSRMSLKMSRGFPPRR